MTHGSERFLILVLVIIVVLPAFALMTQLGCQITQPFTWRFLPWTYSHFCGMQCFRPIVHVILENEALWMNRCAYMGVSQNKGPPKIILFSSLLVSNDYGLRNHHMHISSFQISVTGGALAVLLSLLNQEKVMRVWNKAMVLNKDHRTMSILSSLPGPSRFGSYFDL